MKRPQSSATRQPTASGETDVMNAASHSGSPRGLRTKPLAACLALALSFADSAPAGAAPSFDLPINAPRPAWFEQRKNEVFAEAVARIRAHAARVPARPAATLPVTSCADDGSAGTLRSVVATAVSGDTVDLTQLTCSVITLGSTATDTGVKIDVADLTLIGPGRDALAIEGNPGSPTGYVFSAAGNLTVQALTLRNGHNSTAIANPSGGGLTQWNFGGCVQGLGAGSTITLTDATVSACVTEGKYGVGGGVAGVNIVLNDSTISGNTSRETGWELLGKYASPIGAAGGGVYASSSIVATNSTISDNKVETLTGATRKTYGGGISVRGQAQITGCTLSGNSADYGGGLIAQTPQPSADGSPAAPGFVAISNSTISGNTARMAGGGLALFARTQVHNSTVAFNQSTSPAGAAGLVTDAVAILKSSIVANNQNLEATSLFDPNVGVSRHGSLVGDHNLIASPNVPLPVGTIVLDPQLGPLSNNGGATLTHLPAAGSPAIDAGSNPDGLPFDQRGTGYARVAGAQADIGAVERQPSQSADEAMFGDGFD